MQLIKSPWSNLFFEMVRSSSKSIKITSPFVKENVASKIIATKQSKVSVELITSFKLMNYYTGASDLAALEHILEGNGHISNLQKLHSKIYIFDDVRAVITSGNLTNGGLVNNYEYGVLVDDVNLMKQISSDFRLLQSNEMAGVISLQHIADAKAILAKVPKRVSVDLPEFDNVTSVEVSDAYGGGVDSIVSTLKGWKREVFSCIQSLSMPVFSLDDINLFVPHLRAKYPKNNNIEAKIRQQLQYLRDIGLVEFVGKGKYRKLWV